MQLIQVWVEHKMPMIEALTYQCHFSVEKGMRVLVPLQQRQVVGLVCAVKVTSPQGFTLKHVIKVLDEQPVFSDEQFELLFEVIDQTLSDPITVAKTMLPTLLKPKTSQASVVYEDWVRLNSTTNVSQTKRQTEIVDLLNEKGEMRYQAYRQVAKSLSLKLIEMGVVERFKKEKSYQRERQPVSETFKRLTPDQKVAYQSIDLDNHSTYLLYGTTGSGKTEVYMHLVRDCLNQGKSVFVLVPEVALTPQMIQRFESRFDAPIIIYHSNLSDNQRYYQYQCVLDETPKIIIGTRSSIFLPVQSIGCIILDEEHDLSFKQNVAPFYHARDVALFKANKANCPLVLGSATPSLESYARALKGVYQLLTLPHRINEKMAEITIVDMQQAIRKQKTIHLSEPLIDAIQKRLERKEQVILLLNRRGYLPSIQCSQCYEIAMCRYCDVPLTYHKEDKKLHCHGCGQVYHHYECTHCHHHSFMGSGLATQRLQESVAHLFKNAKVGRLDYDTTKIKDGHQIILDDFANGHYDILIGTQMVAKGLDIPNVTLVGILYADAALSRHDYHVNETTFAMISQAAGRSGRHDKAGEVIVQAFDVNHYVLKAVHNHDYDLFFKHEMHYRKQAQLPPYVYLISVIFVHKNQAKCYHSAIDIKEKSEHANLHCLGPIDIGKSNNLFRYRLVYKSKDLSQLKAQLKELLNEHKDALTLKVNVSPLHLE